MNINNAIIKRIYDPYLKKSLHSSQITFLIGPRQSGKTTSINSLLERIPKDRKFYLNLDSSFERDRVKQKENYLQEQIEETIGSRMETLRDRFYLVVDEA
ncbi:MAG: AAA family ATPase [Candidatus Tectomicrobia bacterium]|uniref:AAA family ATPase n=1 Tax=Tectimicrobiota bacterium TaxID=2528274 RepID=A0A933GJZ2_UNCTE|nr:AAA family ATPase [Candidatus Tectomicrobia bacterium]